MKTAPVILILLILSTAGCGSTPSDDEVDANVDDDVCTVEKAVKGTCQVQAMYFRDELEPDAASGGGDRPGIAGCLVAYSDAECTQDRQVLAGDECISSGDNLGNERAGRASKLRLVEWTDGECHKATRRRDRKGYDCEVWCKKQGFATGQCQRTPPGVCGTQASAYCRCTGIGRR